MKPPSLPVDEEVRQQARSLIHTARHAALGVLLENGLPFVTRVAFGTAPDGMPITLISDLAKHTSALRRHPACSLLIGDPGPKGDPLTHPRLSLMATAEFMCRDTSRYAELRAHYLQTHPKSKLYADFADFHFVRFNIREAHLNGGFARAFTLTANDLGLEG
jgi:putative heme iron utilization protein